MNCCDVFFTPALRKVSGREGSTIQELAQEAGVYTGAQCAGKGTCGKCRVRMVEGNVSPFSSEEARFISSTERSLGFRLACMTRLNGNATVFVPGEHVPGAEGAGKVFSARAEKTNPAVQLYHIDLAGKRGGRTLLETMVADLREGTNREKISIDPPLTANLNEIAGRGGGTITVVVWMQREVVAVLPGRHERILGVAVDVGTTTVAAYLCDLQNGEVIASGSTTNPQVLFGPDIMSRIAYSVAHPGEGVRRMQKEVIWSINDLLSRMTKNGGIEPEDIMDMTVVGNTVMHHIFLGIAPDALGLWPFTASVKGSVDVKARDLELAINPGSYVHVLPVEAGFVGADNVGVLISQEPYNREEMSLIVDLGTNGEIVLGNREILLSASCATGPAFEGAHISCGMRATPGAIERVRFDPVTLEVDYKVVGAETWMSEIAEPDLRPAGLCGSGIIDAVARLFAAGIIGRNGAFSRAARDERIRTTPSGVKEFLLVPGRVTATGRDIVLTQKDIRQVQLAKAALQGGCRVLMGRLGLNHVPKIFVAGAFGMHIDVKNGLTIGLFPSCNPDNVLSIGNAAGHGAYLALVDRTKREEADRVAQTVVHVELAREKGFQEEFRKSLALPYEA